MLVIKLMNAASRYCEIQRTDDEYETGYAETTIDEVRKNICNYGERALEERGGIEVSISPTGLPVCCAAAFTVKEELEKLVATEKEFTDYIILGTSRDYMTLEGGEEREGAFGEQMGMVVLHFSYGFTRVIVPYDSDRIPSTTMEFPREK